MPMHAPLCLGASRSPSSGVCEPENWSIRTAHTIYLYPLYRHLTSMTQSRNSGAANVVQDRVLGVEPAHLM